MKNTKLKALFDVSEEINTTAEQYSDFLDSATSNTVKEFLTNNGNLSITGRSGLTYNFTSIPQEDRFISCQIIGKDINQTIVYDVSDPIEDWEVVQGDQSYTYQDVISDISDQFSLQNTYGSLSNHLTTTVRISDSHLDSIVEDKEFRDLLVDYSKDGYLSQSGFLAALQQMYEATKAACEEEQAIDIDDSRPGYLRGIGAIFSTLLSTLSQIVSVVVSLFSKLLGIIFVAISSLLQALFSKVGASETFSYDIEADTDYINYPIYAKYEQILNVSTTDILKVYEIGALDCYLHRKENFIFDINAFLSLRYDVDRTNEILSSTTTSWYPRVELVDGEPGVLQVSAASSLKLMNLPDSCYLTLDEKYALLADEQKLLNTLAFNIILSFGAILSHNLEISGVDTRIRYVSQTPTTLDCSAFSSGNICQQFFNWCYSLALNQAKPINTTWTFIYDYVTYFRDVVLSRNGFGDPGLARVNGDAVLFTCSLDDPLNMVDNDRKCVTNNIPDSRFLSLPQVEPGTFRKIAIMTALATTVTLITVTAFSRKMRKNRIRKAVKRSGELSKLKQDYENNPTSDNETKYINAVLRQNRRAKIFGGAVYDPSNGWFETANTSSSLTLPALNQIKTLISG